MNDPTNPPESTAPRPKVLVLKNLDQVRVLADALRLRILEAYGAEARTTKQLAKILDEKPSKLYHHVDALEKAGLVYLEHTRQNRGTLEKYFRPVADTFKADPSLFTHQSTGEPTSAMQELVTSSIDSAAGELGDLFRAGQGNRLETEGFFSRFRMRGTPAEVVALRDGLEQWLRKMLESEQGPSKIDDGEEVSSWGCLIALYPVAEPAADEGD